jgi:hypothetical protein
MSLNHLEDEFFSYSYFLQASSKRWALSSQIDKLSINSVWLKEQLSSVNKALDYILSIRSSHTVW